MRLSWNWLLECPEIAALSDNAASIAEHERTAWYERWLAKSNIFAEAVAKAAKYFEVSPDEVRHVALTGLLDAYRTAKSRLQRRMQPPPSQQSNSRERGKKFVSYADY